VIGGAGGIRTLYPLLAKQVLSQLSYSPVKHLRRCDIGNVRWRGGMFGNTNGNQHCECALSIIVTLDDANYPR
jgi:hypothetical protein